MVLLLRFGCRYHHSFTGNSPTDRQFFLHGAEHRWRHGPCKLSGFNRLLSLWLVHRRKTWRFWLTFLPERMHLPRSLLWISSRFAPISSLPCPLSVLLSFQPWLRYLAHHSFGRPFSRASWTFLRVLCRKFRSQFFLSFFLPKFLGAKLTHLQIARTDYQKMGSVFAILWSILASYQVFHILYFRSVPANLFLNHWLLYRPIPPLPWMSRYHLISCRLSVHHSTPIPWAIFHLYFWWNL